MLTLTIQNPSSPGASFTDNTNLVLLKTYEWIKENSSSVITFKEFRKKLQEEKRINDNNNRNIYPLLRNAGFASYEQRNEAFSANTFFTRLGLGYVKALETKIYIENLSSDDSHKAMAMLEVDKILDQILYEGLKNILFHSDANYKESIKDIIAYILRYNKINKTEYAYLLDTRTKYSIEESLDEMQENIEKYRDKKLQIEVKVQVRNDIDLRERTSNETRDEALSFLTSFTYFRGLLQQAHLITKESEGYWIVCNNKRDILMSLLG